MRLLHVLLLAVAACTRAAPEPREDQLVVFAAASLRDAFTAIGEEFERAHPGVKVTFNFAGTQELRTQLEHGAPADVFASADMQHMDALARGQRVVAPVLLARNEPVLVVAKESASAITSFADLPQASRIVLGAAEVPIGRYTAQVLERASGALGADFAARVEAKLVSRELNVRQVLAKVGLGEAQAGIVYRSDAQTALDRVAVVPIPEELNVIAEYPIAYVAGAAHPQLARAWMASVLSAEGQRTLQAAGFLGAAAGAASP